MTKKIQPVQPEVPSPDAHPEIHTPSDPGEPAIPEEGPDIIPDEEAFERPPYEFPPPGEAQ